MTAVVVILGVVYGACLGCYALLEVQGPSGMPWLATMIKVPALLLLTPLVTFLSLQVFNARLFAGAVMRLLVASLAVTLAVLAFVDTADVYGRGLSETIVGKALAGDGRRDRVVLATKVANEMGPGPNERGASADHIKQGVEASLRRLQTDRIDLYQVHRMDLATPVDECLRALDDLVRQGTVRYLGVSEWAPALTVEALMRADRHGWARIVCEQPPYQPVEKGLEPLAHPCLPAGRRLPVPRTQTGPRGCKKPQPRAAGPHLQRAVRALDVTFTADDRRRIDEIAPPGSHVSNYVDANFARPLRRAIGVETAEED